MIGGGRGGPLSSDIAGPMRHRLSIWTLARVGDSMAYFPRKMSSVERGGKILADIVVALLILAFSIVFFGPLGGLAAFVILEAALLGVDAVMPDDDDTAGVAVR